MKRKIIKTGILSSCLLSFLFLNAACGVVKNPLRDYSPRAFNAQEWRAGDSVERGRMVKNMDDRIFTGGRDKDAVVKLLGEPDKKKTEADTEIWFYRVDLGHNSAMPYLPVTFHPQMGTFLGRLKGNNMSILSAD